MTSLRAGRSMTIGGVELIPIERLHVSGGHVAGVLTVFASHEPVAVVIRSPSGDRALDLEGREIPLDDLSRDAP